MNNNSILIDQYLQNEMSAEEKIAFESRLATDKELKEEFDIQQRVVNAAIDAGLRSEFSKAIKKNIQVHRMMKWGAVVTIVVAAFIFYAVKSHLFSKHERAEQRNKVPGIEKFEINSSADTIIETKDGVVFAIPAHAFKSDDNIELEIKTALTPYDIMEQGLSTVSNGSLLQTGGMFYINGYADGKQVDLVKEIAVSVPAKEIDPGMQLFDGVEDKNGNINWVNPKPVEKNLRTYDITTLDFYPPNYIPALKALNKDYSNKKYTDSLYYSFIGYPNGRYSAAKDTTAIKNIEKIAYYKTDTATKPDSFVSHQQQYDYGDATPYEIDPARIKAIWDKKFNNTIIAIKEFEERLHFIQGICYGEKFLAIYLQNLNKPLCESDLLCSKNDEISEDVRKQFLAFAARKDGRVMIAEGMQAKLNDYFQKKYNAYQQAAAKTRAKYEEELLRLENIATQTRTEQSVKDFKREKEIFQQELCINLTEAYQQIGIKRTCNDTIAPQPPSTKTYNVTISTPGWKNLDVYVFDATTTRQSMTYTDPATGKTASLIYKDVSIQIEDRSQYDKVLLYLIPDSLNSFQRVEQNGNLFKEGLNSLFKYDAVALAYKGTEVFYYQHKGLLPGNYTFKLAASDRSSLRSIVNSYGDGKTKDLLGEIDYQLFEQNEMLRQIKLRKDEEFRSLIAYSIYSCWGRAK